MGTIKLTKRAVETLVNSGKEQLWWDSELRGFGVKVTTKGTAAGTVAITAGVLALGKHHVPGIMKQVREFDTFGRDIDPYGEHDFGHLEWAGRRIFWKIDYYDRTMWMGSPDPADPEVTTRVLTIMLAEEY